MLLELRSPSQIYPRLKATNRKTRTYEAGYPPAGSCIQYRRRPYHELQCLAFGVGRSNERRSSKLKKDGIFLPRPTMRMLACDDFIRQGGGWNSGTMIEVSLKWETAGGLDVGFETTTRQRAAYFFGHISLLKASSIPIRPPRRVRRFR